jgi:subtilisin family serine protease
MFDNDGFLARRGEIIALSSNPSLNRRAAALGLQVAKRESLPSLNTTVYRLLVPAGAPIDGILARLRADEPEGVFDRNHLYDSSAGRMGSGAISSVPARALVSSAAGLSMGLIDTGVDVLNPASRGGLSELRYFVDESRVLPETHGTAIASLLVSQTGLLPGAQLYIACVFYEDRRGGLLSEAGDLVRALDWLMERRVPVINMSLSGPPNEVLRAAISRALSAGHLIVAAVGNSGPASPPLYPAAYDGVIAVTAVDSKGHVYRRANRGPYVELAALGVDVVAAAPDGLAAYSGTSFASPYVAALAAMEYRSLDPRKATAVRASLRSNAMDLGKPGHDEIYGFGLARPPTISTAAR